MADVPAPYGPQAFSIDLRLPHVSHTYGLAGHARPLLLPPTDAAWRQGGPTGGDKGSNPRSGGEGH